MVVDGALHGTDRLLERVHGVLQFLQHVAMQRRERLGACEDVDAQEAACGAAPADRVNVDRGASPRANLVHDSKACQDVLVGAASVPISHLNHAVFHAPAKARERAGSCRRQIFVNVNDLHDAPLAADDVSEKVVDGLWSHVGKSTCRGRLQVLAQLVEVLHAHFKALKRLPVAWVAGNRRHGLAVVARRRVTVCTNVGGGSENDMHVL